MFVLHEEAAREADCGIDKELVIEEPDETPSDEDGEERGEERDEKRGIELQEKEEVMRNGMEWRMMED